MPVAIIGALTAVLIVATITTATITELKLDWWRSVPSGWVLQAPEADR